jgi:hypothetical protein
MTHSCTDTVARLKRALIAHNLRGIVACDGPHMDAYWITSPAKMRVYLRRVLEEIADLLDADRHYHVLLESKFWFDLADSNPDPAARRRLRLRLEHAVRRGQLHVAPHYALIDPWRASASVQIQNTTQALIEYRAARMEPENMFYAADLFGLSQMPWYIACGCNLGAVVHTKGASPNMRDHSVGTWSALLGQADHVMTFSLPGGYGLGQGLGRPEGGSGTDGFRYLPDDPELALTLGLERLASVVEQHGALYAASGLDLFWLPLGVDYSHPNHVAPRVLAQIQELLPEFQITMGSPSQVIEKLQDPRRLKPGEVTPHQVGALQSTALSNILAGVHLSRPWVQELSWKMERALWQAQAATSLALLCDADTYPYAALDEARKSVILALTHDQTCYVDPNTGSWHRGTAAFVQDSCQRLIKEALGKLARKNTPEKSEPRLNAHRYKNPDATYSVTNVQTYTRTERIELPLLDGAKDSSTATAQLYQWVRAGGELEARLSSGEVVPVQVTKRQVGREGSVTLRPYAVAVVTVPGLSSIDVQLTPRNRPKADLLDASSNHIQSDRVFIGVDDHAGSVEVGDLLTGAIKRLWLDDSGNRGDLYTYEPTGELWDSRVNPTPIRSKLVAHGPVESVLDVWFKCVLPTGRSPKRRSRRATTRETIVKLRFRLLHQIPGRIDIEMVANNQARDHLLQLAISIGKNTHHVRLRQHGLITTDAFHYAPASTDLEEQTVHRFDGGMVAADGMTLVKPSFQHEVRRDDFRGDTVLVPLIYSVGILSRGDLDRRKGMAGGAMPTPDAQCLGINRTSLRLWVGTAGLSDVGLWRLSDSFWQGGLLVGAPGVSRALAESFSLTGDVVCLGYKRAEAENRTLIVWVQNPSLVMRAVFHLSRDCEIVTMDEQQRFPPRRLKSGHTISLAPGELVTLSLPV